VGFSAIAPSYRPNQPKPYKEVLTLKCHCGCGKEVPKGKKFIQGHNTRIRKLEPGEVREKCISTNYARMLTSEQIMYLRNHYKYLPRTKLAKKLNMDKRVLNFVCIELELARAE